MRKYFSNIQKNNFKHSILVFLFLFLALVGVFGYGKEVGAADTVIQGTCTITTTPKADTTNPNPQSIVEKKQMNSDDCTLLGTRSSTRVTITTTWVADGGTGAAVPDKERPPLEKNLPVCVSLTDLNVGACLTQVFYYLFYLLPSFLLPTVARFFDILIALGLSSTVYGTFILKAWVVVRDLSNVFFILILLYVGIKTILGLGGHETKKMIGSVVVMALLINFSMFFTQVIIDSSNIVALIFYNKIGVETKDSKGVVRPIDYIPVLNPNKAGIQDKDIAGGLIGKFDPSKLLTQEFFDDLKETNHTFSKLSLGAYVAGGALVGSWIPVAGTVAGGIAGIVAYTFSYASGTEAVPIPIILGIIFISGATIMFATYAFLVAGLSFLGRLIELWALIIFSPFAFMSFSVPALSHIEYIGWDSWIKKLLKTAFMAPIFMFFMYLIFQIVQADPIGSLADRTPDKQLWMEKMLLLLIPAILVLVLLLKATKFAKEGAGQAGEAVISGAKVLGGLALGGAALGTATMGRSAVGGFMKGASTGDTAANRIGANQNLMARNIGIINDPTRNIADKTRARAENRRVQRDIRIGQFQQNSGFAGIQTWVGQRLNTDQHNVEHAAHSRHELDETANAVAPGKKWDDLNGEKRLEARRKMERDRVVRDNAGAVAAPAGDHNFVAGLGGVGLGNRKWDSLTTAERAAIDAVVGAQVGGPHDGQPIAGSRLDPLVAGTHADQTIIPDSRGKQGLISKVVQSSVTGTYDVRNLANVVAKEQSTGVAKAAMMLTGAVALGMRGALKQTGVNHGEAQGNFFKDIGNTVSDALKSAKINVDLSHVGEEKKEDHKGGGGAHH